MRTATVTFLLTLLPLIACADDEFYIYKREIRGESVGIMLVEKAWTSARSKATSALDDAVAAENAEIDRVLKVTGGKRVASSRSSRSIRDNDTLFQDANSWWGTETLTVLVVGPPAMGRALRARKLADVPVVIELEAAVRGTERIIGTTKVVTTLRGLKHMMKDPARVRDVVLGAHVRRAWKAALDGVEHDPAQIEPRARVLGSSFKAADGKRFRSWIPSVDLSQHAMEIILDRSREPASLDEGDAETLAAALDAWNKDPSLLDDSEQQALHRVLGESPANLGKQLEQKGWLLDKLGVERQAKSMGERLPFQG